MTRIKEALALCSGNQAAAARLLGMSRNTLVIILLLRERGPLSVKDAAAALCERVDYMSDALKIAHRQGHVWRETVAKRPRGFKMLYHAGTVPAGRAINLTDRCVEALRASGPLSITDLLPRCGGNKAALRIALAAALNNGVVTRERVPVYRGRMYLYYAGQRELNASGAGTSGEISGIAASEGATDDEGDSGGA